MKNILDGFQKKDWHFLAGFLPVIIALSVFTAGINGCKSEEPTPRPKKKDIGLKKMPRRSTEPEVAKTEEFDLIDMKSEKSDPAESPDDYEVRAKRDPFQSFIAVKKEVVRIREPARMILTPLQRYSLDQLKVVGVLHGGMLRKALLEDDVGKGYVVSVGDVVGNQGGKIVSIKSDRIIIEESFGDALGRSKVRQITKKLFPTQEKANF